MGRFLLLAEEIVSPAIGEVFDRRILRHSETTHRRSWR